MSDDPAVHAVADAIARGMHEVRGEHFTDRADFDAWRVKVATWAVEDARPVIEAEARLEAAVVAREAAAAEAEAYRRGCDDTAAELIALSRAAVRTEPENG